MNVDVLIVGGGIAGISLAAALPAHASVLLIETEAQLGYHATGRSAANYSELLASAPTLQLTQLSRAVFENPASGLNLAEILHPLPTLVVAAAPEVARLQAVADAVGDRLPIRMVDAEEIAATVPFLRAEQGCLGLWDPSSSEIDVNVLHMAWARQVEARPNSKILKRAELLSAQRDGAGWRVQTSVGEVTATTIVNAAGAWSDTVAQRCHVVPVPITPLRRTAVIVPVENDVDLTPLPLVVDIGVNFYFKRDGRRLLMSAADENEDVPGDSQPEELDVAIAMDRLETVTTLMGYRPSARWSGLRSFSPDREMVIGPDPQTPGFFWLVGQGGTGIQTAAGAALAAAALLYPSACALPEGCVFDAARFSPGRFQRP